MRVLHVPRMRRADAPGLAGSRVVVGRQPWRLPLARCSPDRAFAYDCVHFLFSLLLRD